MTHLVPVLRPVLGSPFRRAGLYRAAGEIPSWHIAPVRTGTVTDLISGSQIITFTNSSPAWGFNSSGILVQPAANVPFIEYDPATGACLGWRIWDAVTNSIRNNTMVGAVAGTPGTLPTNWPFQAGGSGISVSIVGTGSESGINYLDWRVSGTASANTNATIAFDRASAATGQTWTSSAFVRLAAGSLTGASNPTLSLIEETSGALFITGALYSISLPTTAGLALQRHSATRTLNGGATVALLRTNLTIDVANGATVDFTLRIGLPQLQQSATVGPVVKTSGVAASSTADVASITGAAFAGIYRQDEGTIYADGGPVSPAANRNQLMATVNDGSAANRWYVGKKFDSATVAELGLTSGGSGQAFIQSTPSSIASAKYAAAYKLNDFAFIASGGSIGVDTLGATSVGVDRLLIGTLDGASGNFLNGYIREMAINRSRRPNANLQAMML
jgi:hypothetical protein